MRTDRIILKVMEFSVTNSSLYKNMDLKHNLIVKQGRNEMDWIMMKKSTINEKCFSLFALRDFEEDEVISVYLGEKVNTEEKVVYVFLDINGRPQRLEESGLIQEYWLVHRINHEHFEQVNIVITTDYKISAKRKFFKDEELFMDYNRDVLCSHCNKENC
jgi:hypothetical protein